MSSLCRRINNDPRSPSSTPPPGGSSYKLIALIALFAALAAQPAIANDNATLSTIVTKTSETSVIEWDLPADMDARAGAITVERHGSPNNNNVLWFVTRDGAPRVYRFQTPKGLKVTNANWQSWALNSAGLGPTGGVKKLRSSWDRRFVFVNTVVGLHKVDTTNAKTTLYSNLADGEAALGFVSDLTVDQWNRVYWAVTSDGMGMSASDPTQIISTGATGFIKRVNASNHDCAPGSSCAPAEVIKWQVDGGVGRCDNAGQATSPCLSGIAVHPKTQNLVYYSDPVLNYIGELDTNTNSKTCNCPWMSSKTRRWKLSLLGPEVTQPRQLNIDDDGIVWVVTGSGHLVSLNPKTNRLTKHKIPSPEVAPDTPPLINDAFGVAPDGGVIGYTYNEPTLDEHMVAMLIPKGTGVNCPPDTVYVPRKTETVAPVCEQGMADSGLASPVKRKVPTQVTSKNDGTFVEANISQNAGTTMTTQSRVPMGIMPDRDRSTGAFFYAVGEPTDAPLVKRIGHARLTRDQNKAKHDRDDEDIDDDGKPRGHDDDDDDDGMKNDVDSDDDNDDIMDVYDDDHDNDGIKNEHDTKENKEDQWNYRSDLSASQFEEFEVTAASGALLLLVSAIADSPLASISLEIRNAAGQLVATSVAAPGAGVISLAAPAAGTYIVKVKNHASVAAGISTVVLSRIPQLP